MSPKDDGENIQLQDRPQTGYGPLSALAISAGAASDSALQQMKQGYYWAKANVADKWQGAVAGDADRARIDEIRNASADSAALYQPLRDEYPFITAVGESAPSFAAGLGAGAAALRFGAASEGVQQVLETILARQESPSAALLQFKSGLKGIR